MGNIAGKEKIICDECRKQKIEPLYFENDDSVLVDRVNNTSTHNRYDKYGKQINPKPIEIRYICSNGHRITRII